MRSAATGRSVAGKAGLGNLWFRAGSRVDVASDSQKHEVLGWPCRGDWSRIESRDGCSIDVDDAVITSNAEAAVRDRLSMARAVAVPGERASFLTRNNQRAEFASVEVAAVSGRAFMVPVRADMLALDADNNITVAGIRVVAAKLESAGICPVICNSGGRDRLHLFARVDEPALFAALSDLAKTYGVDVKRSIRPPLAPHRLGGFSRLREPLDVATAGFVLRPRRRRDLNPRSAALLATGLSIHPSDSERLLALMDAMVNCDWSFKEAYTTLLEQPGGASLRKRLGKRDVRRYALDCWNKAVTFVAQNPPAYNATEVAIELSRRRQLACEQGWHRATGFTDRAVLLALLDIGVLVGNYVVSASQRQLAERAGRSQHQTVGKSLRRLQAAGWLRQVTMGSGTHASAFRLLQPDCLSNTPLDTSRLEPKGGVSASGVFVAHDAFAFSGLGHGAALVYETLSATAQTAAEVAAGAGVSRSTVHRALRRLARQNAAVHHETGTWTRGLATPDEVAQRRGSAGARADVRRRHADDRLQYKGYEENGRGGVIAVMPDASAPSTHCLGRTRAGNQCVAPAKRGTGFCPRHQHQIAAAPADVADDGTSPYDEVEVEIVDQYEADAYRP